MIELLFYASLAYLAFYVIRLGVRLLKKERQVAKALAQKAVTDAKKVADEAKALVDEAEEWLKSRFGKGER